MLEVKELFNKDVLSSPNKTLTLSIEGQPIIKYQLLLLFGNIPNDFIRSLSVFCN